MEVIKWQMKLTMLDTSPKGEEIASQYPPRLSPANTCLSRTTLAVEDWMGRKTPREVKEDSSFPHSLVLSLNFHITEQSKVWAPRITWHVTNRVSCPWVSHKIMAGCWKQANGLWAWTWGILATSMGRLW